MGASWMRKLLTWIPGAKHPDTPSQIFINVYEYDDVRRVLKSRCQICDYVVSRDEKSVKELVFTCDNLGCECHKPMGSHAHQVCDVCHTMWRALYANYMMKNLNYFKDIDERTKRDNEDPRRRDRLGL
jgi:hypothetical protein